MLVRKNCIAKNEKEVEIQSKTDSYIKRIMIYGNAIVGFTIIAFLIVPLSLNKGKHVLIDRIWTPYSLESNKNFWLTVARDFIYYLISACTSVNNGLIVTGFMIQACGQFNILSLRIEELIVTVKKVNNSPEASDYLQKQKIKEIVRHHRFIYEYTRKFMHTFDMIISTQSFVTTFILTIIIYELAVEMEPGSADFFIASDYWLCIAGTFFIFCWFGNEVTLKSLEINRNIYQIDWTLLNESSKKELLFIMYRTSRPIIIRSGHFFKLDNETFTKIIKTSFSIFNVLRSSTSSENVLK